jgi:hypothetical protein
VTSPNLHRASNGQVFGSVSVTVDVHAGDCIVHSFRDGLGDPVPIRMHLHSLDEIQGAYQVQVGRASSDRRSANVARALEFAAQLIASHKKKNRRG